MRRALDAEAMIGALDRADVAMVALGPAGVVVRATRAADQVGPAGLVGVDVASAGGETWPPEAGSVVRIEVESRDGEVVELAVRLLDPDARLGAVEPGGAVSVADEDALVALSRVSRHLAMRVPSEEVDAELVRVACAVTGATGAAVFAEHPHGGLVVTHALGWNRTGARVLPGAHSGANTVHATGVPLFAADAQRDPRLSSANLLQSQAASVAIWPVTIDGRTAGAVLTWWATPVHELTARTERSLTRVADAAAVAIERRSLFGRIELIARMDPLTGLGNAQALAAEVTRRVTGPAPEPIAVVLLDLDRFGDYNDRRGHAAGDEVLRRCGATWGAMLGPDVVLTRHERADFALLVSGRPEHEVLATVAALRQGAPTGLTASAGVACWDGREAVEGLLARAGFALHRAKADGRDGVRVAPFATGVLPATTREPVAHVRSDVSVGELRRALAVGGFELHHQPIVDAADGSLAGLEALLRLRDASGALVPPGRFIGVAEDSGLIVSLGTWVIEEACAQIAAWRLAGLSVPSVSVNLSPRQLDGPDVPHLVSRALSRHRLAPGDLCIEVTESAFGEDPRALADVLLRLQGMGVRTAMDDFGAGHSSLARLAELPFERFKVDRSLVVHAGTDARATALLDGVVGLARSLGMHTVVEGVETVEQQAAARDAGATWLQGFLIARPEPADVVARRLVPRLGLVPRLPPSRAA